MNNGIVARLRTSGQAPGRAWAKVGTGLPNTPVMDLVDDAPARALYVATFGHGFYVLRLPGSTVPAVPAGTPAPGNLGNGLPGNFGAIP